MDEKNKKPTLIDKAKTIKEISEITSKYNEWEIAAGQNHKKSLAIMYGDLSHFVFEILQNAEDTNATKVQITLLKNQFIFEHNGFPFSLNDVISICKAGNSQKSEDKIGRFGLGFKSVFAITKTPKIFSGQFNFELQNYNVPVEIIGKLNSQYETTIILPLNLGDKTQIYNIIEERLSNLNEDAILFLNSIKEIEIVSGKNSKKIIKKVNSLKGDDSIKICKIIIRKDQESTTKKFVVSSKKIKIENSNKLISLAFHDDLTVEQINKLPSTNVSVYFPTEVSSGVKFKINAPYQTAPTRQQILKNTQNDFITDELQTLYRVSLFKLKKQNLLDLKFMLQLPLEEKAEQNNQYYILFQKETFNAFQSSSLIKADDDKYYCADQIYLCEETEQILSLFSKKELIMIFSTKPVFLTLSKSSQYNNVSFFLKNMLNLRMIDFKAIYPKINPSMIQNKPDDWFLNYYAYAVSKSSNISFILDNPHPFIKTTRGSLKVANKVRHIAYLSKTIYEPIVYLPSSKLTDSDYIIKKELVNDTSRRLFDHLSIKEITYQDYVQVEMLTKLSPHDEIESIQVFKNIADIYSSLSNDEKKEFINLIKFQSIIPAQRDNEFLICSPSDAYLKSPIMLLLLENIKINYVHPEIYNPELPSKNDTCLKLLSDLNVNSSLKIIQKVTNDIYNLSQRIKTLAEAANNPRKVSTKGHSSHYVWDYNIEYFDLIDINTYEKSKLFWGEIIRISEKYHTAEYQLTSEKGQGKMIGSCSSEFIHLLNKKEWIFYENKFVSPNNLTIAEFEKIYNKSNFNLEQKLLFKQELTSSQFTQPIQKILAITEDLSLEEQNKIALLIEKSTLKKDDNNKKIEHIIEALQSFSPPKTALDLLHNELEKLASVSNNDFDTQKLLINFLNKNNINKFLFNQSSGIKLNYGILLTKDFQLWKDRNRNIWISNVYHQLSKLSRNDKALFIDKLLAFENHQLSQEILNKHINTIQSIDDYVFHDFFLSVDLLMQPVEINTLFKKNLEKFKIKTHSISHEKLNEFFEEDKNKSLLYFDTEIDYLVQLFNSKYNYKDHNKKSFQIPKNIKIDFKNINTTPVLSNDERVNNNHYFLSTDSINKKNLNQIIAGKKTEYIVNEYLKNQKKDNLRWVSENADISENPIGVAGLGYDFSFEESGSTKYVEVKGLKKVSDLVLIRFSINEVLFAIEKKENYVIFLCVGYDKHSTIYEIKNPFFDVLKPEPIVSSQATLFPNGFDLVFSIK